MDPVQELIAGVGLSDVEEGGHRPAQGSSLASSTALDAPSAPAPASPPAAAPPRRTKMVFLYSDEDDVGGDGDGEGRRATQPASGVAEVLCDDHAIAVSADALAKLQTEAAEVTAAGISDAQTSLLDAKGDADGFSFEEDVLSGLVGGASASFTTDEGMRVREVTAPELWEGAVAVAASSCLLSGGPDAASSAADELPLLLRRGLPAADFVLQSRRKRFREVPASAGDTVQSSPKSAAAAMTGGESAAANSAAAAESAPQDGSSSSELHVDHPQSGQRDDGSDSVEVEVEEELDVYPVFEENGRTVRALRTRCGYELTLDERDLLEDWAEGDEEDAGEGCADQGEDAAPPAAAAVTEGDEQADDGDHDAHNHDAPSTTRAGQTANSAGTAAADDDEDADADLPVQAEAEDCGDFRDFSDEEDEEEAELDEAIIVAVVEQLLRCCEADDLDPKISVEAGRFIGAAKPLLEQLTNEVISPAEFVQRMERDLRRFQRIYQSIYRPRDSPIVIDGVVTDL
ncbi:conserved hypothetical protein [Leishmania mexicana MHOM/GT/2001/U1103]|uniref:Uncharacterized protein n=1 Tax=Leishmania mexicana (strain MHOM/GT/2001/U1103) TaxID=929439 RepID=E9B071_LEIMU|nr:conserved hypothetical protein [Leishmania mexicana MHOM/GT/2001/U1103]CBZ28623.1 conserved hypothetical protein [Leishmania mexicana MHOM/GT/2001/U1103]